MSDGPGKLAPPEALPLDDIILGEDDATDAPPPVAPKASAPPPPKRATTDSVRPKEQPSTRPRADDGKDARKRAKMTLRIPDDEVSRPTLPATTPAGGIPALSPSRPPSAPDADLGASLSVDEEPAAIPLRPNRIIAVGGADDTLELPPDELRARMAAIGGDGGRAQGIDTSDERGWTPYQPTVADGAFAPPARGPATAMIDVEERPSDPPASEEIPVDVSADDVPDPSSDELATYPRLPTAPDSEEIKIEEADRVTDHGEAQEVGPEDLVSVESIPRPPPPPKGGAPAPAKIVGPSGPALTATALMSGASPQPPPVKPASVPAPAPATPATVAVPAAAPPPVVAAPAAPPPVVAAPAAPPPVVAAPAASSLRRPTPAAPIVVPPVAALAPPPMNEAAANRKKNRPWWEELFNDDYIRTMAKVTDAQIAREVSFIEESLGCEAGAMILDLACGTGRHAVEMAARGYQVVGFDLSLAMLARASDEAQERKQKINFVQGDMREMTFEEMFDGVFSWNTSFGFFDEEKNAAVIAKVHRSLKKGGQFLLDVVNRDYLVRQSPSLAWYEGDGCICMDEMHVDFITSRMKVKRTIMMDDGRTKEIEYSIRVYALHELGKLLHDNGFRVAEVSGRTATPGVFFGCESPRTLILAEKR